MLEAEHEFYLEIADDDLESFNKIADIIDISGGLETSGVKDKSKIDIFLNKVKQIQNET